MFGNVEVTVLINRHSLLNGFLEVIKHKLIHRSFWQSSSLLKEEVSMCIVLKHVIAFSLSFEIFIYIPILPHQHFNLLLFNPCSFSLLTFQFFSLPFVLLFCLSALSTYSLLFALVFLTHYPPLHHCLLPLLPFLISNAARLLRMTGSPYVFQTPTFAGDVQRTVRSAPPPISAQNVNLEWGKLVVTLSNAWVTGLGRKWFQSCGVLWLYTLYLSVKILVLFSII